VEQGYGFYEICRGLNHSRAKYRIQQSMSSRSGEAEARGDEVGRQMDEGSTWETNPVSTSFFYNRHVSSTQRALAPTI
jgi:hypothetical protein